MVHFWCLLISAVGQQPPSAESLVADWNLRLSSSKAVTFDCRHKGGPLNSSSVKWIRDKAFVETNDYGTRVYDGAKYWHYDRVSNQYEETSAVPWPQMPGLVWDRPLKAISPAVKTVENGRTFWAVPVEPIDKNAKERALFDLKSGFLAGYELTFADGNDVSPSGKAASFLVLYENISLNAPLKLEDLRFVPPPGSKVREDVPLDSKLLPLGAKAPEFQSKLANGNTTTLKEQLKGRKALLLTFWFFYCGPCRRELPEVNTLYNGLKAQGLGVLGVNYEDSSAVAHDYSTRLGLEFPSILSSSAEDDVVSKFGVLGFPTNYLLDSDGVVIARTVGTNLESIKEKLKQLGFEIL